MTEDRIKEIQSKTAYADSISVQQALLQVWNECSQEAAQKTQSLYPKEQVDEMLKQAFMRGHSTCRCITDNHTEALELANEYVGCLIKQLTPNNR